MVAAGSKSGGTVAWVGENGCTVGGKGADYGVEADEGGYYAPWVHGREVGYIVEEAAKEDVVGEGEYWSGGFFEKRLSVSPKRCFERERGGRQLTEQ